MAKINKDSLRNRIAALKERLEKATDDNEKAFLRQSIEYKQAILNDRPDDEIESLAGGVKDLRDSWTKVKVENAEAEVLEETKEIAEGK